MFYKRILIEIGNFLISLNIAVFKISFIIY